MGVRGPKAKTDQEQRLTGNAGGRASKNTGSSLVVAVTKLPDSPKHLIRTAAAEWRRIGKDLIDFGKLTPENLKALELYCQNYGIWRECENTIAKEDRVITANKSGYKMPHPAIAIGNKAQDNMMKWLKILRDTHPAKMPKDDKLAEFFNKCKNLSVVKK